MPLHRIALLAALLVAVPPRAGETAPKKKKRPPVAETHAAASATVVRMSAELSGYGDTDAVYVASPTISLGVADELTGWSVNARYLVDAVSAASVDVVSSASNKWTELRHVGSGAATFKAGSVGVSLSGGVSHEPDYLSLSGGGSLSFELMEKNFTPFVGVSYGHDDVGRSSEPKQWWRTLQKLGGQTGATFVVSRSTIASVAFDAIFERGYLGKPYRYVPLFGPGAGLRVPVGASVDEVNRLRLDQRPADAVPDARDRFAVTARIAHRLQDATFRIDQRIYRDSWGALASTTDTRYALDLGPRVLLWPHLRLHAQQGVSFWQRAYEASASPEGGLGVPRFRTGDRELGPLVTATFGFGFRWRLSGDGPGPWVWFFQADGILTRYSDALYITERRGVFSATGIEVEFD